LTDAKSAMGCIYEAMDMYREKEQIEEFLTPSNRGMKVCKIINVHLELQ